MTAQNTQRPYKSPLREEQARHTRERIIDAFAEQMTGSSLDDFSISRVAKRAGVSLRTVYHHFPNRESILAAMQSWFDDRVTFPPIPSTVDGLEESLDGTFRAMDANEPLVRAILASGLAGSVRSWGRPGRRRSVEDIVRSISGDLTEEQVQQGTAVLHYLFSMSAWRSLKDESQMSGEQIARALKWAAMTLVEDLKRQSKTNQSKAQGASR
jgi:AcrR family transcriptional regulator